MFVPYLDITYNNKKCSTSLSYDVYESIKDSGILIMTVEYFIDSHGSDVFLYMKVRDDYKTVLQGQYLRMNSMN